MTGIFYDTTLLKVKENWASFPQDQLYIQGGYMAQNIESWTETIFVADKQRGGTSSVSYAI
jgi:hypothetical protein